jgi:hypothetical protein
MYTPLQYNVALQPHSMEGTCPSSWLSLQQLEWNDTSTEPKFRLSVKKTNPSKLACVTVWLLADEVRCARQLVMFVLCWINYVLWSCDATRYPLHSPVSPSLSLPCVAMCHLKLKGMADAYWMPTPVTCFPFISPPMLYHVPSHTHRNLPNPIFSPTSIL